MFFCLLGCFSIWDVLFYQTGWQYGSWHCGFLPQVMGPYYSSEWPCEWMEEHKASLEHFYLQPFALMLALPHVFCLYRNMCICGFSQCTWFQILKIWNQTGDVIHKPTQCSPSLSPRQRRLRLSARTHTCQSRLLSWWAPDSFANKSVHFHPLHYDPLWTCTFKGQPKKTQKDSYWTRQADFIVRMGMYSPKEIGFINKTFKNCWSIGHHYGRSMKNQHTSKKQLFVCGRCVSATGLLTLDGIVAQTTVEGSMTKELFLEFLEHVVVRVSFTILRDLSISEMHYSASILHPLSRPL